MSSVLLIIAACLALGGVAIVAYVVSLVRQTTAVRRVTTGLAELAGGNLAHRVVVPGGGELARLALTANRLAEAMQEARSDTSRREEAHRQLISNLSHDLRTPITSIAGYVDALQRGIGDDAARHVDVIAMKTAELARLADDLFYLTRLDAGDLNLDLRPVDLNEVTRCSLLGFENELHAREIDVHLDIPEASCLVMADEAALGRIIGNFVANSLKHARSMRQLGVDVSAKEGGCTVTVWNDGEGFPKGVMELLERGTSVGPGGGTGLGLSIAHDLAARMDATLRVKSEPGQRTAVTVTFPPNTSRDEV